MRILIRMSLLLLLLPHVTRTAGVEMGRVRFMLFSLRGFWATEKLAVIITGDQQEEQLTVASGTEVRLRTGLYTLRTRGSSTTRPVRKVFFVAPGDQVVTVMQNFKEPQEESEDYETYWRLRGTVAEVGRHKTPVIVRAVGYYGEPSQESLLQPNGSFELRLARIARYRIWAIADDRIIAEGDVHAGITWPEQGAKEIVLAPAREISK